MQKPIGGTTTFLMIFVAALFDGIQALINLIPIAGQIINRLVSFFALMTFWLWFKMYGVSFSKGKNLGTLGIGFLVELIPLVDILPAWTLAVYRLIAIQKIQNVVQKAPIAGKVIKQ